MADDLIILGEQYLMANYGRLPLVITRGEGARVWDSEGKCYLDFVAGIAVNSVGHRHPQVVAAIKEQADQLLHCSNIYWFRPTVELAEALVKMSGLDKAFFCNSGAEANEAAIKLARKYAYRQGKTTPQIITFTNAFHGRTLGTLAATGQPKFSEGFEPLPGGFRQLPFNDCAALREAVTDQTAALLVEPVQGEGGVYLSTPEFMETLVQIRQQYGLLLIFDEVQCGLGRTGNFFAYEHYGVRPDILTLAKALGGGLPIGATLARAEVSEVFQPGSHGSTFGGNPIASAAAIAVLKVMQEERLPERAAKVGAYFMSCLEQLQTKFSCIRTVRGLGLMIGMELDRPGQSVVNLCQQRGLLINCTAGNVVRFIPPLIINENDVDQAVAILADALDEFVKQ